MALRNLFFLCQFILQPIRNEFGPLIVTSGYRSIDLNKFVGGKDTSQHLFGEAADFVVSKDTQLVVIYNWIIPNITFGQCLLENIANRQWIHISLPRIDKKNQEYYALNHV
jgi:hypothetical protein